MVREEESAEGLRFSTRRSLLLASIIIAAILTAAELVLRVVGVRSPVRPSIVLRSVDTDIELPFMRADREALWSPRPRYRGEFMGGTVSINGLGMRGPAVEAPRPGWRRFGDSITFGYGVGDEQTYAHYLGRELAGGRVEVLNAGVTGYTSSQVLARLRRLLPKLKPDVVLVCIGWNDGTLRPVDDEEHAQRLRSVMPIDGFLDHLYLYRGMKSLYVRQWSSRPQPDAKTPRVSVERYRENLGRMVVLCREAGARIAFIDLPRRRRPGEGRVSSAYAGTLVAAAREMEVPLLTIDDLSLNTSLDDNARYFIDSLHLSPEGNAYLAKRLLGQLVEHRLL